MNKESSIEDWINAVKYFSSHKDKKAREMAEVLVEKEKQDTEMYKKWYKQAREENRLLLELINVIRKPKDEPR